MPMPTPTVTALLDLALKAERLGRFPEAREKLRRAIALDGDPATLDARLRLGRLLIETGQQDNHAEAERELLRACALAEQTGAMRSTAAAVHLLALRRVRRSEQERARKLLAESPAAGESAVPSPARAQWLHYNGLLSCDRGDLNAAERHYFRARTRFTRNAIISQGSPRSATRWRIFCSAGERPPMVWPSPARAWN